MRLQLRATIWENHADKRVRTGSHARATETDGFEDASRYATHGVSTIAGTLGR